MLYRTFWLLGLGVLIIFNLVALVEVSKDTCDKYIPILLSRALTTDPYRGITLAFCLIAVASSLYLNSILIIAGFFGFFGAFLVSMFQTNAHNALILVSSAFLLYETWPTWNNFVWALHWCSALASGALCMGWLAYSEYGCETEYCSKCSYWYITEYVFFWSLYGLVYWRIPEKLQWRDHVELIKNDDAKKAEISDDEQSALLRF
jgi:hypothetical protein